MGWDAPSHWLIVLVILAVLFGYKKLPDASRAVGRSLRIFKTEIKGMTEDDKTREAAATPAVEAKAVEPVVIEKPAVSDAPVAQPSEHAASTLSSDKPTTSAD